MAQTYLSMAALLLCSTLVDAATEPASSAQDPSVASLAVDQTAAMDEVVEEVLVVAPEPRYVAPTLRDRIGRIWAPVRINGQGPFRLVLDTGASHSAVIARVATSLGIPLHGSTPIRVHGVTGSAIVSSIAVDRLEVGDLLIAGARLPVVADVFGGADGVLGTQGLSDKRILIDFKNDRIEITHSRRQRAGVGFSVVPLTLERGTLLAANVQIGSIRTTAIIDTGAQQTIGNSALRKALIRRQQEFSTHDIIGVTLDVARGDSIPTPPIALGAVAVRGLHVTFTDMFIFEHWKLTREPTLLVGMDVLGLLDVLIIDYRLREMHIRPRR